MAQKDILWIGFANAPRLSKRFRHHHATDQLLHGPSVSDEVSGQRIQQFRMGWFIAQRSQVVYRSRDATSEHLLPDPIHHQPRRKWILWAGDAISQFQPTAALAVDWRLIQNATQQASWSQWAEALGVTADEHRSVVPWACIGHRVDYTRWCKCSLQAMVVFNQCGQCRSRIFPIGHKV